MLISQRVTALLFAILLFYEFTLALGNAAFGPFWFVSSGIFLSFSAKIECSSIQFETITRTFCAPVTLHHPGPFSLSFQMQIIFQ